MYNSVMKIILLLYHLRDSDGDQKIWKLMLGDIGCIYEMQLTQCLITAFDTNIKER